MLKKALHVLFSSSGLKLNSLLFSLVIAQWQGASFLGSLTIFLSVHSFGLVLAKLGLFYSLEKKISEIKSNGGKYIASALIINFTLLFVLTLVLILFSSQLNNYISIENATTLLILAIIFGNFINFNYAIIKANFDFELFSKLQFSRDFLFKLLSVILLFFYESLQSVLFAKVIIEAIFLFITLLKVRKYKPNLDTPTKELIRELTELVRYNSVLEIRAVAFNYIDIWMINFFLGEFFVGVYQIAWQISSALLILGKAMINVTFPYFSKWSSNGEVEQLEKYFIISFKISLLIPIPAFVLALFLSTDLMSYFGEDFGNYSIVLIILLWGSIFRPLQEITSKLLVATANSKVSYYISLFSGILNIMLNLILIPILELEGAALATTFSNIVIALIGIFYVKKVTPIIFKTYKILLPNIISSLFLLIYLFFFISLFDVNKLIVLLLGVILWCMTMVIIEKKQERGNLYDFITRGV